MDTQQIKKRMKRGLGARPPLESEMREAQSKSKSAFEASRMLGLSYNTYKKYAKAYGIFENLKNPFGYGIRKNKCDSSIKPKNISDEEWNLRKRRRELREKHLHKYHTKDGSVQYGCALYFITIPKGDARKKFIERWGNLPIKIGISKDVVQRYNDLVLKKEYVTSDEEKWVEWNTLAEVINMIPFYTWDECVGIESRIHKYIRDYKIKGLITKAGNEVEEMFEADFEKINEAIETYVTGWRTLKWSSDEMNNDYGYCKPIPYSIQYSQYCKFGESEIGSEWKFF